MSTVNLKPADRVEITILVENYTDLLLGDTEVVKRPDASDPSKAPLAEHGLSCILKVSAGLEEHVFMMDAGLTAVSILHNMDILKIDPGRIEALVLSHGHMDHYGGLIALIQKARKGLPIILHPHAFLERRFKMPKTDPHRLDEASLKAQGAIVLKNQATFTLASNLVLVTGEVERVTDFEKGFPSAEAKVSGEWVVDPFRDDQGVALHVKGKGLVVLSGCSHAGIINTVKHAQKVTGIEKVHAVLGGFHLNGPPFEPIIGRTIDEMKKIGPDIVAPMHCTGWKAMNQFAEEMPDQFMLTSVGSTYVIQGV